MSKCICKGNWRAIVKKCEPLLGKRFTDHKGQLYSFFGVVHAEDDYFYGMSSIPGHVVVLLSCACDLDGFGFKEAE